MGGSNSSTATLPQIWQRIDDSHLRHRTTLEIIQQHPLVFPSKQHQMTALAALHRRIALHHPAVPRVIYFRQDAGDAVCNALGGEYRVTLYSQYCGDCLERVAEEKGERLYHAPCQCAHLLSAVAFLREHFGCFLVTPRMVFLGTRRQRIGKVWLHSQVSVSQPEFPATEAEMCASLCRLLEYMKNHKICLSFTQEQLQIAAGIKQLYELRNYVFGVHKSNQTPASAQITRKKANSESTPPVKDPQLLNYSSQKGERSNSVQNNQIFINNFIAKPPKIQFSYKTNNNTPQEETQLQQYASMQLTKQEVSHEPQRSQTSKMVDEKSHHFTPKVSINALSQQVSHACSPSISPESKNRAPNFTSREIELPLKEMEDKGTSSRLPTTSRSPKLVKEPVFHPIQEVPEFKQRRITSQEPSPRKKEKTVSLHSSGNKFEKYRDAIRNYQEKLRQKFANSTGSNPLTAKRKEDLVIRPPPVISPQKEYKEAESLYNSSQNEEERQTSIANKKEPSDNGNLSPLRDLQQTNENSNEEELQNKRLREQLQKLDMERDLEREKALIESEMQGLLKENNAQEYRNIRDKIKQKKETFAQLKAEAAKILEDLDY